MSLERVKTREFLILGADQALKSSYLRHSGHYGRAEAPA
jgi:hypothetical protein